MTKCSLCKEDVKSHPYNEYPSFCEPCAKDLRQRRVNQELVLDTNITGETKQPEGCIGCGA